MRLRPPAIDETWNKRLYAGAYPIVTLQKIAALSSERIETASRRTSSGVVSEDGRWARFFLLFKTGQNGLEQDRAQVGLHSHGFDWSLAEHCDNAVLKIFS